MKILSYMPLRWLIDNYNVDSVVYYYSEIERTIWPSFHKQCITEDQKDRLLKALNTRLSEV